MCTTFNHVIFKMTKISKVSFLICLVEFLLLFFILLGCYMYLEVTILVVRKTHSYLNFSLAVFSSRSGGTYKSRNKKSLYAFAVKVFM